MGFKEMVAQDNARIILNTEEFAEYHNIRYDGAEYRHIPVVLEKMRDEERQVYKDESTMGVYRKLLTAYLSSESLNGKIPEQGHEIRISRSELSDGYSDLYHIIGVDVEYGMVRISLEAYDD